MILILCSWLLLFGFFTVYGTAAHLLIKSEHNYPVITVLLGMVLQTILITTAAFFGPIGIELFFANSVFGIILGFIFRKEITLSLNGMKSEFLGFSKTSKAIFILILLSALLKCAQSPFILDNESYYVQTIKWLNEYGFVKGLANLNIAYGQTSGWHILQSGFNFSFYTDRINDINGLLLIICSFFFLSVFEKNYRQNKTFHWMGFILVFNVLTFQFLDSPSPDLPVFLISQLILFLFLKNDRANDDVKTIIVLFAFLVFIKITIFPLGILLLLLIYKTKTGFKTLAVTGILFGALWIAKNTVLIGYPLYPFKMFALDIDWKITQNMLGYINNMVRNHEFIELKNYKTFSLWQKFQIWIRFGGINGLFNKGILVLFILALFTKQMRLLNFRILYFVLLIHFVTVFIISPQFRFFLSEFVFLSAILFSELANRLFLHQKLVKIGLIAVVILPVVALFLLNSDSIKQQNSVQKNANAHLSQLWLPEHNSKYNWVEFKKLKVGNLEYYSPKQNFFFYGTADGPLPCTNEKVMKLFATKYYSLPQMRTDNLKDGFKSITVPQK